MKRNYSRRRFLKTGAITGVGLSLIPPVLKGGIGSKAGNPARLGGPVPGQFTDPAEWVKSKLCPICCPIRPIAALI